MSPFIPPLDRRARRQVWLITLAAVAVFATIRLLPTGTNLSHMDFRVTAKNSIDFCDPLNPQFIPVVAVASPVSLSLKTDAPPVIDREVRCTLTLRTARGKPIAPEDLLVSHTRLLHLLIVDTLLGDYQHLHPEPAKIPGEWTFSFTPHQSGSYRVFADFTPAATGRSLYADAELAVLGRGPARPQPPPAKSWVAVQAGYHFELLPARLPVRARQPTDLKLKITREGGGRVPMEPVMGAYAHLVAFDRGRSGFAHLHPMEVDLAKTPDSVNPELNFKVTIPLGGTYVIWVQVNLGGREAFVPFWFEVEP